METPANPAAPEGSTPANSSQDPATPPVDLASEAGKAAKETPLPPKEPIDSRSLEDAGFSAEQLAAVKAHTSRAVNDAVSKSTSRAEEGLRKKGFISHDQMQEALNARDADHQRSAEAKDRFLTVLSDEGHAPGSAGFNKVSETYAKLLKEEKVTPQILLNEAGIRSLVMMSGVSRGAADGSDPLSGLEYSTPAGQQPEFTEGTEALGGPKSDTPSMEELTRSNMVKALRASQK